MSKWDIQVNGVVKVLKDTAADAKGFETQATKMGSAMQSAAPNGDYVTPTVMAVPIFANWIVLKSPVP